LAIRAAETEKINNKIEANTAELSAASEVEMKQTNVLDINGD